MNAYDNVESLAVARNENGASSYSLPLPKKELPSIQLARRVQFPHIGIATKPSRSHPPIIAYISSERGLLQEMLSDHH